MYARIFRHQGYESILEGEITETGVGFVLKRRLATLRNLFRFRRGRRREKSDTTAVAAGAALRKEETDSVSGKAGVNDNGGDAHKNDENEK